MTLNNKNKSQPDHSSQSLDQEFLCADKKNHSEEKASVVPFPKIAKQAGKFASGAACEFIQLGEQQRKESHRQLLSDFAQKQFLSSKVVSPQSNKQISKATSWIQEKANELSKFADDFVSSDQQHKALEHIGQRSKPSRLGKNIVAVFNQKEFQNGSNRISCASDRINRKMVEKVVGGTASVATAVTAGSTSASLGAAITTAASAAAPFIVVAGSAAVVGGVVYAAGYGVNKVIQHTNKPPESRHRSKASDLDLSDLRNYK